jgi:hypothetical protein
VSDASWIGVLWLLAAIGGGFYAWWDATLPRIRLHYWKRRLQALTAHMAASTAAMRARTNDICGMKCHGGSEQRKCGCVGPRDCVMNRGGVK